LRLALNLDLIHVTPPPIFAWFKGLNDGVLGCMKMLGGMFVLGGIAATDVATLEAQPEVNPRVAHLQAFLASFCARMHFTNRIQMRAHRIWHDFVPPCSVAPASRRRCFVKTSKVAGETLAQQQFYLYHRFTHSAVSDR
jgi:hypothetical protein